MIPNVKNLSVLGFLVLTVYVMRQANMSMSQPITNGMFRQLWDYARPTSETCDGVTLTSAFSADELTQAANLQKSLASVRNGNPLQTLLTGGNPMDNILDYVMGLIPSLAVWAALFIISLILCICACCNWCCIYGCCKNCKCCRCCKKPQGTRRKRVYQICSLVFMLALFSAGIAGATMASNVPKGIKVAYCSLLNFLEDLTYGYKASKWLGLGGVIESIDNVLNQFDGFMTSVNSLSVTPGNANDLDTGINDVKTKLQSLINNNNYVENRPDPNASPITYVSDYIDKLGPDSDSSTFTGIIVTELQTKRDTVISALQSISPALDTLKTQSGTIKDGIRSGKTAASDVFTTMKDLVSTINKAGPLITDAVGKLGQAILGIFIAYIIIALLPIVSIVLIHFLKIKFFSKVLHFSWCLMGLLAILGFLASAILYPVSVVFTELCQVLNTGLTDQAYFDNTIGNLLGSAGGSQAKTLTTQCIFGDGKALESLGIQDKLSDFDTIFTELDKVGALIPMDVSSSPIKSIAIEYQSWYVDAVRKGLLPDSTKIATDLAALDALTTSNSNSCTPNKDIWLLSHTNCSTTAPSSTVFGSSIAADSGKPNPTCIGFDNWASATPSATASNRYGASDFPGSCATINGQQQLDYVRSLVDRFTANRASIASHWGATGSVGTVLGDLYSVKTTHDGGFGDKLYQQISPVFSLKDKLVDIQDSFIGPDNGLLANTNCKFVGDDLRQFSSALCTGFITSLYQASVVIIVVSMFSFFGTIAVFCLAKRILNEDTKKETEGGNEQYQY